MGLAMSEEDKRVAVGISITLSSQLIAAALAMLAILAGYVSFALGQRQVGAMFYLSSCISFGLFTASIYSAGKAITRARDAGYQGNWSLTEGRMEFNVQATTCLFGIAAFFMMMFFSRTPVENSTDRLLEKVVSNLTQSVQDKDRLNLELSAQKDKDMKLDGLLTQQQMVVQELEKRLSVLDSEMKQLQTLMRDSLRKPPPQSSAKPSDPP